MMRYKFLQKSSSLILMMMLTGCATTNSYHEPVSSEPYANIHGQSNNNLFAVDRSFFSVESIDDKNIGMVWSCESNIRLVPGPHDVKGYFAFRHTGFWQDSSKAVSMTFHLNAVSGENYTINGIVQNDNITGWITDSQGRQVSAKVSEAYLPEGSRVVDVPELPRG